MPRLNVDEFKYLCREFLSKQGLAALRPYGRAIGVEKPTAKNMGALVEDIVSILAGESEPKPRSVRGAPIKDDHVDPAIYNQIQEYCDRYPFVSEDGVRDGSELLAQMKFQEIHPRRLVMESSDTRLKDYRQNFSPNEVYEGQLHRSNEDFILYPLNLNARDRRIHIAEEGVQTYGIREGDVVTCRCREELNELVASEILSVNEVAPTKLKRKNYFDDLTACEPKEKLTFYKEDHSESVAAKCFEWLFPLRKGQRTLVAAPLKTGKSSLLLEMATALQKSDKKLTTLVLLIDQSPENVGKFRKMLYTHNLIYTTYEDCAEDQVFAADFILNRAKRIAESGKDVCLLVDSFNALARAYNYTELSVGGKTLAGGMESKSLQYIKKYLGAARRLEHGGSLTIVGAFSTDTGDPADELLETELSLVANLQIRLSESLARERVYPAFDLVNSTLDKNESFAECAEIRLNECVAEKYLPVHGWKNLVSLISQCISFEELQKVIKNETE